MKRHLSFDIIIAVLFAAVLAFSLWNLVGLHSKNKGKSMVIVEAPGQRYIYPLDINREVKIPGVLGDTVVKIEDGRAWVVESPCANKICVQAGKLNHGGQWASCLPNAVFVKIEGQSENNSYDVY